MKIVLLNPPHRAIGSRVPGELLPPLGLLAIGGPLIDAGHELHLVNADLAPMSASAIATALGDLAPDGILIGHPNAGIPGWGAVSGCGNSRTLSGSAVDRAQLSRNSGLGISPEQALAPASRAMSRRLDAAE